MNGGKRTIIDSYLVLHISYLSFPTFPTCYPLPFYGKISDMNKSSHQVASKKFLGITTLGEKGQIVIPAEARAAMKLTRGEKLIVMGNHDNVLIIMKASRFETMASHLTQHLASVRKLMKKK